MSKFNTNKEAIFDHIPTTTTVGPAKHIFSIFNGYESLPRMKDHRKSHMHNKSFEPVTVSTIAKYSNDVNEGHSKAQHFTYGAIPGGDQNNRLIYGSLDSYGIDLNNIKPKPKAAQVKKYYQTPDSFVYGQRDFLYNQQNQPASKKLSNIFSMEERTSAEMRKKQREVENTEKEYHRYKKEKEENRKRIEDEKRRDHEMLTSYKAPWGKAGGGAPNERHERSQQVRRLLDDKEQTFPFGRPGAGAPLKTNSGNLKTGLSADPEIRFQKRDRNQIHNVVNPEGRAEKEHRKFPYETNLDILAHETRAQRKVLKRNEDMSVSVYDPFGRPGAGAPLRDDQGKTQVARSRNLIRTVKGDDDGDNHLTDASLQYGTPRLKKEIKNKDQTGFYGGFGRAGGGAPNFGNDGIVQTSKRQMFVTAGDGAVIKTSSDESLDFRGGGGAPIRDSNGNFVAAVSGKLSNEEMGYSSHSQLGDMESRKSYLEALRQQAEEHENLKRLQKSEQNQQSVDTGSWIKQGKVGRYPVDSSTHQVMGAPRLTSDIVKQRYEIKREDPSKSKEYHEALDHHARLHEQSKQLELQQERERSVEHARTMDAVWGKPGHGAPSDNSPRRRKHIEVDNESVHQVDQPNKYMRLSTHDNPIPDYTDYPYSPTHSDSGDTVQEKTVSYVRREKDKIKGLNILQSVVQHEKISNTNNRHQEHCVAPFATDFDSAGDNLVSNTSYSPSIRPVLPPRDFSSHPISDQSADHLVTVEPIKSIYNEEVPPPPGTIKLSNAVKRKLTLRRQSDRNDR